MIAMLFWIISAVLTFIAVGAVFVPFMRKDMERVSAVERDKLVYHARIAEIDKDVSLGRLGRDEADAAKAEEGRKLIKATHDEPANRKAGLSGGVVRGIAFCLIAFVPLSALVFYLPYGQPEYGDMRLAARMQEDPTGQTVEQLLGRAEAQLAANPQDGRGWQVVAPIYMRVGRFDDAVLAYRNTIRLSGESPARQLALAEAITFAESGVVTEEARQLFLKVLQSEPDNAKAAFYAASALQQANRFAEAEQAWQSLIERSPPDAAWLAASIERLNIAREQLGKQPYAAPSPDTDAPGTPTDQQVRDAGDMSIEDRVEMINGMVESLEERLAENPDNLEGWQRLIRSYIVLGRENDAIAAVRKARTVFADNSDALAGLPTERDLPVERNGPQTGLNGEQSDSGEQGSEGDEQ